MTLLCCITPFYACNTLSHAVSSFFGVFIVCVIVKGDSKQKRQVAINVKNMQIYLAEGFVCFVLSPFFSSSSSSSSSRSLLH